MIKRYTATAGKAPLTAQVITELEQAGYTLVKTADLERMEQEMGINEHHPEILRINGELEKLCNLEPNWNGYGAGPIDPVVALMASDIVEALIEEFPQGWSVVPGDSGNNLQLEIHNKRMDLEIYLIVRKDEEE